MEYEIGNFDQGQSYLDRVLEAESLPPMGQPYLSAVMIPLAARISGVIERLQVANNSASTVLASPSANPLELSLARRGLSLIAVLQRNPDAAQEQYTALQPYGGTVHPIHGCVEKILGLLAQTIGNLDQAIAHFEDALALCRKSGYRPELAWTCCDYADTLLQRNNSGDAQKATSLLDESLAISNELGMRPLMERVLSRRDILKA